MNLREFSRLQPRSRPVLPGAEGSALLVGGRALLLEWKNVVKASKKLQRRSEA